MPCALLRNVTLLRMSTPKLNNPAELSRKKKKGLGNLHRVEYPAADRDWLTNTCLSGKTFQLIQQRGRKFVESSDGAR